MVNDLLLHLFSACKPDGQILLGHVRNVTWSQLAGLSGLSEAFQGFSDWRHVSWDWPVILTCGSLVLEMFCPQVHSLTSHGVRLRHASSVSSLS